MLAKLFSLEIRLGNIYHVRIYRQCWKYWYHDTKCIKKVKEKLELDMSIKESEKYTWAHSKLVRKIAQIKDTAFYRELRQRTINDAREYFPSLACYEFPTPTFRDCFFSYAPSKEENCIAWKPWYTREQKIQKYSEDVC